MKIVLNILLMITFGVIHVFGQNGETSKNYGELRKTAWHYDVGIGYQSFDPSALKTSLQKSNYSSDLSEGLLLFSYGIGVVFFDRLVTGVNFDIGSTTDFNSLGTNVGLTKFGAGFKLGYDIWSNQKHKFSLLYQLGIDGNELSLDDNVDAPSDFGSALDQRRSQALFSGNVSNRFLARYDFLFKQKQDESGLMMPTLGLELGYHLAGENSWDDIVNGPEINNTGIFANVVFSTRLKKYKKTRKNP